MTLKIIDEADMAPELDAAIRRQLCLCFPHGAATFSKTRAWHGCAPAYTVVVEEGGGVIAHAGVVDRTITVGECSLRTTGVQNVFVVPPLRGTGLSRQVTDAAIGEAERRGFEIGLLFCRDELVPLYARSGWRHLQGRPVMRIDPGGREVLKNDGRTTMYYPIGGRAFPDGLIHLNGDDW